MVYWLTVEPLTASKMEPNKRNVLTGLEVKLKATDSSMDYKLWRKRLVRTAKRYKWPLEVLGLSDDQEVTSND